MAVGLPSCRHACLPAFNKHNQKLKVTSSFGLEREREGGREAMREQGEREGAAAMLRSSEFQWSRRLFAATAMLNPCYRRTRLETTTLVRQRSSSK